MQCQGGRGAKHFQGRLWATETLERLVRLHALREDFADRLRDVQSRKPVLLLHSLFGLPFLTVPLATTVLGVRPPTARQAIDKLVDARILELLDHRPKRGRGRPPKLYQCPEILAIVRE